MNTRPVPLCPGNEAWIKRTPGDGLTDDLSHNLSVLVLRVEGYWAFVQDNRGRQRRISTSNLDGGSEYQGRSGHWYAEDDVVVQRSIVQLVAKLENEKAPDSEIEKWRAILDRHPDVEL